MAAKPLAAQPTTGEARGVIQQHRQTQAATPATTAKAHAAAAELDARGVAVKPLGAQPTTGEAKRVLSHVANGAEGLQRAGKPKEKWAGVAKGSWSPEDDERLLEAAASRGSTTLKDLFVQLVQSFPGRTASALHERLKKLLREQKEAAEGPAEPEPRRYFPVSCSAPGCPLKGEKIKPMLAQAWRHDRCPHSHLAAPQMVHDLDRGGCGKT